MTGAARRAASLVDRHGEDFTIGAVAHRGVFSNVTVGADRSYMSSGEVDGALVPLYVCLVKHDDTSAVGDSFTWNTLTFIIKRILEARFQRELAAKMLVLSRESLLPSAPEG